MKSSIISKSLILDTNVIVSAHLSKNPDAATKQVYSLTYGQHWLIYTPEILREYVRVLHYPKFHFSPALIRQILLHIRDCGFLLSADASDYHLPDSADQPFYNLVTTKSVGAPLLITSNLRHFPHESFILSPRQYLVLAR